MDSIITFKTAVTHQGIREIPGGNILCRAVELLVGTLAGEAYTPHSLQQRTARMRLRSTLSALLTLFPRTSCDGLMRLEQRGLYICVHVCICVWDEEALSWPQLDNTH